MLTLTVACAPYDRVRALFDGRVRIQGVRLVQVPIHSEQSFPRAFSRAEFDVTELSLSSHLLQLSRGEAAYAAIPAFVSRAFRHGCIYLRADAGIRTAKDLDGRRVGIPEYQMTLGLWLRGILSDDHGVDVNGIAWRTAGTNAAGRRERLPLELPPGMDVQPIAGTLNEALLAGELDAILSPTEPAAFAAGDPRIVRLFPDPRAAAQAWHRRTGFHPIMHLIGIRQDVLARDPSLAPRLMEAFAEAKRLALADIESDLRHSSLSQMLPFHAEEWAATKALLGPDPWTYGIGPNRAELEAICRWSHEQHLSRRRLAVAEVFAAGVEED
ncbi:substrate-binding domain-containing protein [Falsiroseomonas tokyonensis]|uniref:ABC transporter substrate-binding protein n=1 Tax=Falsiroseomonas tokyonensis TaxID=430521 RepID=A0ABV7BTB9_9PROT|nr:ABC transporter substrate-binding protein [Falsiroseomonas tokyonensis]MBU8537914.1 ABC transporter substrate-binding protein [Falsiroseomonas tokyonensis]